MIKTILHQILFLRQSQRQCAQALGISKGVVGKYAIAAKAAGLSWADIEPLDEAALERRLFAHLGQADKPVIPDYAAIHRELSRKGVTLMLLWQEYQANHLGQRTLQYSQFCERYRQYAKTLKRSMRQVHRAGEKLFVDFAGPTLALSDGSRAHLFVSALGASHYTYAQALPGQRTVDWITGMTGALHFMGGVPELIVPDNARGVIARPDRYEPRANDTVLDFAQHYGCTVLPARPRTPQDKASVESAVQVVERWVLARLRHRPLADLAAANRAIQPLVHELNARPFQKLPGSRASVFNELDAPALGPLPAQRYEYARFKTVRVHVDYHVEVERHRYSVPHALVGAVLDAHITAHTVELLHRHKHPEHGYRSALALLVQQECDYRHQRRSARLLQQARLKYPQAAIEDFDSRPGRGIERTHFLSLALGEWVQAGQTLILTGATGCGKTWLSCALAQYACRQGHSARYLRVPRLAEELRTLRAAGSYTKWLAQLAKTQVLVLDDWALVGLDALTRETLMEIIDDRAATRATLISSQLPIEHWHAWIGEPALADAMLDRLLAQAHRIVLKGESMRAATRSGPPGPPDA